MRDMRREAERASRHTEVSTQAGPLLLEATTQTGQGSAEATRMDEAVA